MWIRQKASVVGSPWRHEVAYKPRERPRVVVSQLLCLGKSHMVRHVRDHRWI